MVPSSADPVTIIWRGDDAAVLLVAPTVSVTEQRALALGELAGHLAAHGNDDVPVEALSVRHHCPGCGSTAHGVPSLDWTVPNSVSAAPALPQISFSRSRGWLALAWSTRGRIGVDIDDSGHAAFADGGLDETIFTGEEQRRHRHASESRRRIARAQDWVAKEALAKASGVGFSAQDPSEFTVTAAGDLMCGGTKQRSARLVPSAQWDLPSEAQFAGLAGALVVLPNKDESS